MEERRMEAAGKNAKAFLNLIDEEAVVTLGMISDAGDESLLLTRFLDEEAFDKKLLTSEAYRFMERISALFLQGGCLVTGYTHYTLQLLKEQKVVFIDRVPKVIGGKKPAEMKVIVERCMQRMRNWVVLARCVVEAEFPHFEALQAFSVLRLWKGPDAERRTDASTDCIDDDKRTMALKKLANVLGLDIQKLTDQFFDHQHVAAAIYEKQGVSCFAAWRLAIEMTTKSNRPYRLLELHPNKELVALLVRDGSLGGSTSGVERLFSISTAALGTKRADLSDATVNDELLLTVTY
jgi:hypothetical protein